MFLKAVIVSAIGGILSGRFVRNGWKALFLLVALASAETAFEAVRHSYAIRSDLGLFGVLDTVGSTAVLVGEALSV